MLLQAVRPNSQRQRVSKGKSAPAPVEGWDAVSPRAGMDPKRAIVLDNWFPQPGYVEVRKGYSSWSTGMGSSTPVQTLMVYNGLTNATNKMFGIAGGTIYDCTSSGAASSTGVTSLSSSRWQYVNYTTSAGTAYLWCVSGADDPRHYNGSAWATPSVTGVTGADIINVNVHKKRLWGILTQSMDACYFALDSISGAATKFPLGSVMQKGGYLVAMGTWTLDAGLGPDDYAVFISSRGQVAVYQGTNPASDFTLQGVFDIGPPIGYRCFRKVAGDLAVVTLDGVLPLSKALGTDRGAAAEIAMTLRINNAMNVAAQSYASNFGWELTTYPKGTAAILNVPLSENSSQHQYVMNTLTGAWCRFTGWNANTFAVFNDSLYFGSNIGIVYKAWTGAIDGATAITATGQTAYNYYGMLGTDKRFTALQPLITTDQTVTPAIGISTDYRDNAIVSTPSASSTASALYDSAIYDTDVYAVESRSSSDWTTISGVGQCAAIHFRATSSSASTIIIQLNGFNITFEPGEFY